MVSNNGSDGRPGFCPSGILPLFRFCLPVFQAGLVQSLNAQYVLVRLSCAFCIELWGDPHLSDSNEFAWKGPIDTSIVYLTVYTSFVAVSFTFLVPFGKF